MCFLLCNMHSSERGAQLPLGTCLSQLWCVIPAAAKWCSLCLSHGDGRKIPNIAEGTQDASQPFSGPEMQCCSDAAHQSLWPVVLESHLDPFLWGLCLVCGATFCSQLKILEFLGLCYYLLLYWKTMSMISSCPVSNPHFALHSSGPCLPCAPQYPFRGPCLPHTPAQPLPVVLVGVCSVAMVVSEKVWRCSHSVCSHFLLSVLVPVVGITQK